MKTSLNRDAGCRIDGSFKIVHVPDNFHVSTHSAESQPKNDVMKHIIHELTFGDTTEICRFEIKESLSMNFERIFGKI